MYTGDARRRLSHLWQLPLLVLSIGLFVAAAVLFVEARPEITLNQKLSAARAFLRDDRPDAAAESIARLMAAEKFPREQEAQLHLALAEALDAQQRQQRLSGGAGAGANHLRVIEHTQIALAGGVKPSGEIHRRLGESYEALGKPVEAVGQYRQAIAMDPRRALRLQRKVIDLQLATSDWAPAEASLDAYVAAAGVTDAERAWAHLTKAQLLIDRGDYVEARGLLDEALRLDPTELAQAEARHRSGVCAWKLGRLEEAEKLLKTARAAFRGQHPLDADAAYALGRIAQEKNDPKQAIAMFDVVVANHAAAAVAPLARLSRGVCRIQRGEDEAGVFDLRTAAEQARATPTLREEALAALRKGSTALSAKRNLAATLELLALEQSLEPSPSAGLLARLAEETERRANQVLQSIADAEGAEKLRRNQLALELIGKAADARLAQSRALLATKHDSHGEAMWKAVQLYHRAGMPQDAIAALELFVSEQAADPLAPEALLRLGQAYVSSNQAEKAISAYQRLQGAYANSPAALKAAVPLAALYTEQGSQKFAAAEQVLLAAADAKLPGHAEDQKAALFQLGGLYHRMGRFPQAIERLEAFTKSYAADARAAEATFLTAECYRASAAGINIQLASATAALASATDAPTGGGELARAAESKKLQLSRAAVLYDKAADLYRAAPPTRETDRRYPKLAALRRADCDYELGHFAEAIGLYNAVAARYADDPVALAAAVQVVNSYCQMNKLEDARAANERARALLARMPQGAFEPALAGAPGGAGGIGAGGSGAGAGLVMPKAYWEQWLKWSGTVAATTW